jgi:riboflavin kinase/FMN adenylyltransferase
VDRLLRTGGVKVFTDAAAAGAELRGGWVTIGNFDGLHLGHRHVVSRAVARAAASGAPSIALTFRPHPASVLGHGGPPAELASAAQQEELFASAGLSASVVQRFDLDFAKLTPEAFVRRLLEEGLGARGIVVGSSFRFGAGRAGDVTLLRRLGETWGCAVEEVVPVVVAGEPVSSSRIRKDVADGRMREAWALLGRPHAVEGRVAEGDHVGRTIGFPTANVEAPAAAMPGRGVHACTLRCRGALHPAVANIGTRPTFGGAGTRLEVHALGEIGDVYGETVRVAFLAKLRDERAFASVDELRAQIERDVARAREVHGRHPIEELARLPAL